jgi:hypothetical protein
MSWQGFKSFVLSAFSENGVPSASRVISGWLCISSMALIWFCVRHAMNLDKESAMVWVGGLPAIIYALATFTVSPYGVNQISKMFQKKDVAATDNPAPTNGVGTDGGSKG